METLLDTLLTTAKSAFPSWLKSPEVMAIAPEPPVEVEMGAEKFPPPRFKRTLTVPQPPALMTTISGLLSPLKSAKRMDMGELPAETTWDEKESGCAPNDPAATAAKSKRGFRIYLSCQIEL